MYKCPDETEIDEDELETYDTSSKKPMLPEVEEALKWIEIWSLFDESSVDIKRNLNATTRKCQKHYIDSKRKFHIKQFSCDFWNFLYFTNTLEFLYLLPFV